MSLAVDNDDLGGIVGFPMHCCSLEPRFKPAGDDLGGGGSYQPPCQ